MQQTTTVLVGLLISDLLFYTNLLITLSQHKNKKKGLLFDNG
ncbi:hypothetical protein VIBNIWn13_670016 [Vibrio nigripulchritudo Wn13]|nr:hypothetical protein VIBNISFn135_1150016 [Vibrio nigripulchritudo SFn135]CCO54263.1 hypothetical protein VIBNIWn13_670016 [Vibrio nigripulchritudo Wn13]